jgi:hypothetical protein
MLPSSSSSSLERHSHTNFPESGRATPADQPYVGHAESLVLPEGPVSGQTAELLQEFVHPRHRDSQATENTLTGEEWSEENEVADMKKLPWWKRPSPYW